MCIIIRTGITNNPLPQFIYSNNLHHKLIKYKNIQLNVFITSSIRIKLLFNNFPSLFKNLIPNLARREKKKTPPSLLLPSNNHKFHEKEARVGSRRKLRPFLKLTMERASSTGERKKGQRRAERSLARRGAFRDYPVKTCVSGLCNKV